MDDFIKEMAQKLPPIGSTDGQGMKAPVIVVFADDYGIGKYLITEGERLPNNDFELFGYGRLTDWEWGSILLSDLLSTKLMGIEFKGTIYADGTTVMDLCDEEPRHINWSELEER